MLPGLAGAWGQDWFLARSTGEMLNPVSQVEPLYREGKWMAPLLLQLMMGVKLAGLG